MSEDWIFVLELSPNPFPLSDLTSGSVCGFDTPTSLNPMTTNPQAMGNPSFRIPVRPTRNYPYSGGVEYEGKTVFRLTPDTEQSESALVDWVEAILEEGPYRYGDFFDLPMPLYLVCDDETGDVFRVSIRDGTVALHVLPATESAGLSALYDRLTKQTAASWRVECEYSEGGDDVRETRS